MRQRINGNVVLDFDRFHSTGKTCLLSTRYFRKWSWHPSWPSSVSYISSLSQVRANSVVVVVGSVDINALPVYQQLVLYCISIVTTWVFVNSDVIFARLYEIKNQTTNSYKTDLKCLAQILAVYYIYFHLFVFNSVDALEHGLLRPLESSRYQSHMVGSVYEPNKVH